MLSELSSIGPDFASTENTIYIIGPYMNIDLEEELLFCGCIALAVIANAQGTSPTGYDALRRNS